MQQVNVMTENRHCGPEVGMSIFPNDGEFGSSAELNSDIFCAIDTIFLFIVEFNSEHGSQ